MAKRARLPDDVPQGQELATRRKQQTIHSAARRRAEFNALITELDGTLKAAEPEKGAVGEKGSGGKVQILERAASEFKEIENDSAPRKVKRLPQELSSKLKAEKASFHEMWKHSQVGVFMATPKMEALDANPYLLKTMDYRPFEVKHLWNLVHPDSLHTAYREVGQVATGKQKYARVQARLKHKDGSYHWWYGHLQMVRKDQVQGIMGVMVLSGVAPASRLALVDLKLPGFPDNIDANHLVKAFAWSRDWDQQPPAGRTKHLK
eukprot:TRINITY_DN8266_c0_g1_i3.p1 TRINITY_DN8266_c0_g1~~TRINITY_DN8266_c0_g1_i3.p1  ORF type:complete len:263 (-),score=54.58 TRINITY_DN8266_c0_g1_i3:275-1063(-)